MTYRRPNVGSTYLFTYGTSYQIGEQFKRYITLELQVSERLISLKNMEICGMFLHQRKKTHTYRKHLQKEKRN